MLNLTAFMRHLTHFTLLIFTISTYSIANAANSSKEILIDNDKVQVVRLTYPPGTESGMHIHEYPSRVVYIVEGGQLALIPADAEQQKRIIEAKAGQALFVPAQHHNIRNIGQTTVILVETEIK